jgi:hypothetical protein
MIMINNLFYQIGVLHRASLKDNFLVVWAPEESDRWLHPGVVLRFVEGVLEKSRSSSLGE